MTTAAVPPIPTAQLGRVATIGYHQPQAWQIVTRMLCEHSWHLVDISADRRAYLEEWSGGSLRRHFGYSYHPVPELGTLHDQEPDQPVQLADPASGLAIITTWLEAGIDCLLLCACPQWQHWHRRHVATLLKQTYPALKMTHLVPDAFAVDLPPWCFETVALLQRYGLLNPLPHTPQEQPVLLCTAKSQGVALPGYGQCTLSLSVCLWMPVAQPHVAPNSTQEPAQDAHEQHPSTAAARERSKRP
jgi:hypothetical protein